VSPPQEPRDTHPEPFPSLRSPECGEIVPTKGRVVREVGKQPRNDEVHAQHVKEGYHRDGEVHLTQERVAHEAFSIQADDKLEVGGQGSEHEGETGKPTRAPKLEKERGGLVGRDNPGQRSEPPLRHFSFSIVTGP
jgi:hypothetical protein